MNIHEYQAKALLARYGIPTLAGAVAYNPTEALEVAKGLGGDLWVVKAQIHAGGRGKAGGVKVVRKLEEIRDTAQAMLGKILVTPQTGPQGKQVHRLYIEQGCDVKHEFYLSLVVDRAGGCVTFIASTEGGVDIEEVAAKTPEKITKISVDPALGIKPFQARTIAFALGLTGKHIEKATALILAMGQAFIDLDMNLIEINPLILTKNDDFIVLDAKVNFDDNALYRHKDIAALYDPNEEDPAELEARQHELNYVKLDGNIGCMVNGAGLAMATMDIIKFYEGSPANFLDVGGGATRERVTKAFKIILSDPQVKGILVNIFGGIMRCDIIAEGIVAAVKDTQLTIPLVVRLQGTNMEKGREILKESGLSIIAIDGFAEAAQAIIHHVQGAKNVSPR